MHAAVYCVTRRCGEKGFIGMLVIVMPLRDRLRELRTAAGLTQQALAMKAGLSISVVVHLEGGRIPDPRVSTVKALAGALGASVDELLTDDEPTAEANQDEPPAPAPKRRHKRA
jgi:transcriptional regulator with XRE-family HTH domain